MLSVSDLPCRNTFFALDRNGCTTFVPIDVKLNSSLFVANMHVDLAAVFTHIRSLISHSTSASPSTLPGMGSKYVYLSCHVLLLLKCMYLCVHSSGQSHLRELVVRRNAVILKTDWTRNEHWSDEFYRRLRVSSRSYDETEREISNLLQQRNWKMLPDKIFKRFVT